jgi:hypothetical protein
VGIPVIRRAISEPTFLPGLQLENGNLVIDTEKLQYPGDMLHEAGHLATMPPGVRETMSDNLPDSDLNRGGEMMALAWSYAAAVHIGLDLRVVFHPDGYRGGGDAIIQNFAKKNYIGVPMLQWAGMTYDEKRAPEFGVLPYPNMIRWLRES